MTTVASTVHAVGAGTVTVPRPDDCADLDEGPHSGADGGSNSAFAFGVSSRAHTEGGEQFRVPHNCVPPSLDRGLDDHLLVPPPSGAGTRCGHVDGIAGGRLRHRHHHGLLTY
ncbi:MULTISPECIES: hypothetical protein [unclassified Nonomuraea]|uniref:hypothetical protein n=1 Tax=unclassified Nonomuraea TaxID=2593643 RepID=UPI0033DFA1EC